MASATLTQGKTRLRIDDDDHDDQITSQLHWAETTIRRLAELNPTEEFPDALQEAQLAYLTWLFDTGAAGDTEPPRIALLMGPYGRAKLA